MAGGKQAVNNSKAVVREVRRLAAKLHLDVAVEYSVGRRLWGAKRKIDVVLKSPTSGKILGVECKGQRKSGTAEEKIPTTIQDIKAWPIEGIVVFSGEGFTTNMRSYLISTGKAVALEDLEPWLRLYFGLPLVHED